MAKSQRPVVMDNLSSSENGKGMFMLNPSSRGSIGVKPSTTIYNGF
jgi:hypothetical protein